jgi:hypothetical protein
MNPYALLGGVARVLRTVERGARAVLGVDAEEAAGRADSGAVAAVDFSFECASLLARASVFRCIALTLAHCSADNPAEAELAQAWEVFAASQPLTDEAARAALDAFLDAFVRLASAWAPAEPTSPHAPPAAAAPGLKRQQVPAGCSAGHPAKLLRALAAAAEQAATALEQGALLPHRALHACVRR